MHTLTGMHDNVCSAWKVSTCTLLGTLKVIITNSNTKFKLSTDFTLEKGKKKLLWTWRVAHQFSSISLNEHRHLWFTHESFITQRFIRTQVTCSRPAKIYQWSRVHTQCWHHSWFAKTGPFRCLSLSYRANITLLTLKRCQLVSPRVSYRDPLTFTLTC